MARAASDSKRSAPSGGAFGELGATGLRQFGGYVREEWLRDLSGWRGVRMFREMRDNDPIIGAMFFATEMLLRAVSFHVDPVGKNPDDAEAADFVNSCVADMEQTWAEIISQVITFLQYGWQVSEIVYKRRQGQNANPQLNSTYDDGMIGWRKFAGRAQETLLHWEFNDSGDAIALVQLLPTGGPLLRVPLSKCLHFRTRLLKNSPEGVSALRNAYTSYFYKKRLMAIEAIGLERDLTGMPIAWVPARLLNSSATADDKAQLEALKKMARDTVRNEQEGFVFPLVYDVNGNKLYDFTLLSTGGRRQFDTSSIIDRYDHRIAATMLADFITLGGGGGDSRGSYAQSRNKTDMFSVALVGFLDLITGEFNRSAIPDLLRMNNLKGKCVMQHGDIARRDLEVLADYAQKLTSSMLLTPDPVLEAHLREEGGLPPLEGETQTGLDTGAAGDARNSGEGEPGKTSGGTSGELHMEQRRTQLENLKNPPDKTAPGANQK